LAVRWDNHKAVEPVAAASLPRIMIAEEEFLRKAGENSVATLQKPYRFPFTNSKSGMIY